VRDPRARIRRIEDLHGGRARKRDGLDIRSQRRNLGASLDYTLLPGLMLSVTGRNEKRDGTRPFGFGTYIRRQGLSGIPGTGAGNFWRETVEARGVELLEPLDYSTTEFGATLAFAKNGHSFSGGFFQSEFRNDITTLYFDNPFEATPGRASATIFDPNADQEPGAPNGNNNLRGLVARSVDSSRRTMTTSAHSVRRRSNFRGRPVST
jgi:hypothetical protein